MRYCKDIMLEKAILHVIDSTSDEANVSKQELTINEEVEEFVRKHIVKSLNSDDTYSAAFTNTQNEVAKHIKTVIDDKEQFLVVSQMLADHMFNTIKNTDIPSGDLLFVQYIADEKRCFAILKLDYQSSQTHTIDVVEESDELLIGLTSQEIGLPRMSQGLKKCAFFTNAPEDKIEIIVVNKRQKIEDGNEDYFVQDFMEALLTTDDTSKTRNFKPTIERWTQKNLSDQIGTASQVRAMINEKLLSGENIEVDVLATEMFEEVPEVKESFLEAVRDQGYREGSKFEIDKTFVEKKMKTKQIKTDTGIVIKGDFELFKDSQKFIVRDNNDGTQDIVIKNVRNVVEK